MLGISHLGFLALGELPKPPLAATQPFDLPARIPDARYRMYFGPNGPVLNPETITRFFESRWHEPWSEPKRFKPILHPGLNLFNSMPFQLIPNPSNRIQGWHTWLAEPVWPKKGLKTHLQQTLAQEPLKIQTPQVFITLLGIEAKLDSAVFGINVYNVPPPVYVAFAGANVTIKEIPATRGGAASMAES